MGNIKNIQINEFNRIGYDVIYPRTNVDNIEGLQKATEDEAIAGVNNSNYMTPYLTKVCAQFSVGAQVIVTVVGASAGAPVTATMGTNSITVNIDSDGKAIFILGYGTWTISISQIGKIGSTSVTVTQYETYAVTLSVANDLESLTWAEIKALSDAGTASSAFAIGDAKSVLLNGIAAGRTFNETLYVYIIGFNHNSAREGDGITFQGFKTAQQNGVSVCLLGQKSSGYLTDDTGFIATNSSSTTGGWNNSFAYTVQCPAIKALFPSDLQTVIKTTTLWTNNTGSGSNVASDVTSNTNEVFYLAEFEIFGACTNANSAEQNYQKQYTYYASGNSAIKYRDSDVSVADSWWCRSPAMEDTHFYCCVSSDGRSSYNYTNAASCSAPCFKV